MRAVLWLVKLKTERKEVILKLKLINIKNREWVLQLQQCSRVCGFVYDFIFSSIQFYSARQPVQD